MVYLEKDFDSALLRGALKALEHNKINKMCTDTIQNMYESTKSQIHNVTQKF